MEKQKLFAISVITRGFFIAAFIFESIFGLYFYYDYPPQIVYWILLRIADTGSLLFMTILVYQLRQLYTDKRYATFYWVILISCVLTGISNISTILATGSVFVYIQNEIIIFYNIIVCINFLLFFIGWIFFSRFAYHKKKRNIAGFGIFTSICSFLSMLVIRIPNLIDYFDNLHLIAQPRLIVDYYFLYSLILIAIILFLNFISNIFLGIILFRHKITESEELLTKNVCKGCKNLIDKTIDVCPYCGYIINKKLNFQ